MSLTERDFEVLAGILRATRIELIETIDYIERGIIRWCEDDNDRFDRERFKRAASIDQVPVVGGEET